MPKITFRADADLVERVEELEASKSEVMRDALRSYLEDAAGARTGDAPPLGGDLDGALEARIDERLDARLGRGRTGADAADGVTVNVTLNGQDVTAERAEPARESDEDREADGADDPTAERTCPQCGETVEADHAFCTNCGGRAVRRPACECGTTLRSEWAYCPDCGRRTVSAEVLDR